jgi:hypothetical protein
MMKPYYSACKSIALITIITPIRMALSRDVHETLFSRPRRDRDVHHLVRDEIETETLSARDETETET